MTVPDYCFLEPCISQIAYSGLAIYVARSDQQRAVSALSRSTVSLGLETMVEVSHTVVVLRSVNIQTWVVV